MSTAINTTTSTNEIKFDFTTIDARLELGSEYPSDLKKIVADWNSAQVGTDLSKKYQKISVKTLDGRITSLNYSSQGQYASLPSEFVTVIDEFFAEVEKSGQPLSRKKVHALLDGINKALPDDQKIGLGKDVELGLIDCLIGRKLVGNKFQRSIKDICRVIVRTYYARLNGKELSVVYKGL